ncbi:hypothetical protein HU200_046503 [Digitaria exilis]|uniref:non-specific serine/threonine protein kinase n=1 Tax=Digitaria exilis TaxID=1010633 RepID=A0A835EEH8_9POAL|nr:hypothetical protein HU200_046503 [Digitaria exilis]
MGKSPLPPPPLMGRYELGKLLGKGSFAKVYHALHLETGEQVAIKIMDKVHLSKSNALQKQVMREIDIMRRVRHPNIVRIHEVMATKRSIFVVMEFVAGGSLDAYLAGRGGNGVGEASARRVFQQLVSAVDYCHSLGVYHGDIKPDNILVDATGNTIKVADFGLSALADASSPSSSPAAMLKTICGTPMFIAPEVFLRRGYDGAMADVWACGVVLFALAAGRFPFNERDDTIVYHKIRRCDYHCPPWFSAGLVRFIRRLMCPDPARRITIAQIKENPWFKKGFKEIPRSIVEPENGDSNSDDSDDESTVSLESSSEDLSSSPVEIYQQQQRGYRSRMHTSVSAPSLTTLESNGGSSSSVGVQGTPRVRRLKSLNAFDIIVSSPSLNLTGLFEEPGEQMRFVSAAPVAKIISKLEEIAGHVSLTTRTKEFQVSIEGDGSSGALLVSARIFELTPELVMVKVCKKAGNAAEYRQFCDNELKPGLRGLVDGPPEEGGEIVASEN